jgi:hypothetical protein
MERRRPFRIVVLIVVWAHFTALAFGSAPLEAAPFTEEALAAAGPLSRLRESSS